MKRYLWLVPVIVVFCVFSVSLGNFFVYDDFIWLLRAKTLPHDLTQMFSVDVVYFDPLIYLSFWLDSLVGGLNPTWYQAEDIVLHAVNATLVYKLARELSDDDYAGLLAGLLFGSSFAVADAVLWPSSRVDLVSVMFALGALLAFQRWAKTIRTSYFLLSLLFFVLALGAKGTPVVLPAILAYLWYAENKSLAKLSLAPFVAVVAVYFVLLSWASKLSASHAMGFYFNPRNLALAVSELFIPERLLTDLNPYVCAAIISFVVAAFACAACSSGPYARLGKTGLVVAVCALMPVLVIRDFKLAVDGPHAINLLSSPSHRLYFASVGVALFCGAVVRNVQVRLKCAGSRLWEAALVVFICGVILVDAYEVRQRNDVWDYVGKGTRAAVSGIMQHRDRISEDAVVGLVQFPGSDGFMAPMIKVFLGLQKVTTLQLFDVEPITNAALLQKPEKLSLFVLGVSGGVPVVYDLSEQFRELAAASQLAFLYPGMPAFTTQSQFVAEQLNLEILKKRRFQ